MILSTGSLLHLVNFTNCWKAFGDHSKSDLSFSAGKYVIRVVSIIRHLSRFDMSSTLIIFADVAKLYQGSWYICCWQHEFSYGQRLIQSDLFLVDVWPWYRQVSSGFLHPPLLILWQYLIFWSCWNKMLHKFLVIFSKQGWRMVVVLMPCWSRYLKDYHTGDGLWLEFSHFICVNRPICFTVNQRRHLHNRLCYE